MRGVIGKLEQMRGVIGKLAQMKGVTGKLGQMRGVIGKLGQTRDVGNNVKDEGCDWEIKTDDGRGKSGKR